MHHNKPNNFYIKHFFIIFQIKKLQPIFDAFVPPCIYAVHDYFKHTGGRDIFLLDWRQVLSYDVSF
jgi:hypothetical protein